MTIKIILEQEKNPVIERYENDLKVGSRKVNSMDLQKMFADELPIDVLLSLLIHDRIDEFSLLLENTSVIANEAADFISVMFDYINTELSSNKTTNIIEIESLLKHTIATSESFDVSRFSELIFLWSKKLVDSNLEVSEPIKAIIRLAKKEHMPIDELIKLISIWSEKIGRASEGQLLSESQVSVFVNLMNSLISNGNANLKHELIRMVLSSTVESQSTELRAWLQAGLRELTQFELEDEITRRSKEFNVKKEIRFFAPLPRNASFMAYSNKGNVFYYDLPKTRYFTKFHSTIFKEKVGFPRLLFALTVDSSNNVIDAKLAAVKGEQPLSSDTKLYKYPYSNVFSDGKLCFSYKGIPCDELPDAFLSTSNNNHLNAGGFDIFKKFEGIDFDDDLLQPLNLSLADFY